MIKYLTRLMTAFAGFLAFLLMGNTVMANPVENVTSIPASSDKVMKVINLNVSSPLLQLDYQTANPIFEHLGCSCAVCTQGVVNFEAKF